VRKNKIYFYFVFIIFIWSEKMFLWPFNAFWFEIFVSFPSSSLQFRTYINLYKTSQPLDLSVLHLLIKIFMQSYYRNICELLTKILAWFHRGLFLFS
jgi:hypothetical protein